MLRIRSKRDGFWRCGVQHSKNWTEYPDGQFTAAEVERLKAEPVLVVEVVKEKPAPKAQSLKVDKKDKGQKVEKPKEDPKKEPEESKESDEETGGEGDESGAPGPKTIDPTV